MTDSFERNDKRVRFAAVGDLLLTPGPGSAPYARDQRLIGNDVCEIFSTCDIVFGNLECTLPGDGACVPTEEVLGLTGAKNGGDVEFCWNPVVDDCVEGYALLGADSPEAAGNFTEVVPDTGLVTCHTFDPSETYFLVVGTGTGGTGLWGHFGQ